jgi:hypothetical protein
MRTAAVKKNVVKKKAGRVRAAEPPKKKKVAKAAPVAKAPRNHNSSTRDVKILALVPEATIPGVTLDTHAMAVIAQAETSNIEAQARPEVPSRRLTVRPAGQPDPEEILDFRSLFEVKNEDPDTSLIEDLSAQLRLQEMASAASPKPKPKPAPTQATALCVVVPVGASVTIHVNSDGSVSITTSTGGITVTS